MLRPHLKAKLATAVVGLGALLVSGAPHSSGQPKTPDPSSDWQAFQKTVQPFFAKHCFDCRTDKPRGDVQLDQFADEKALARSLPTLEKVLDVLDAHAMPPKKRKQPSEDELKPVLAWLEGYVERTQREAARSGRVLIRRLNRAEYNTVRDLLGVHFQPADDFLQDPPGHGFDNIAGTLSVSPVVMEKYLASAEKVARAAVFGVEPLKPERVVHEPFCAADAFSKNAEVKFDYDETGIGL
jgi:hypothetical protein